MTEEIDELTYEAFNVSTVMIKTYTVSGGGIGNGNSHSQICVVYNRGDTEESTDVYYEEIGKNPSKKRIGSCIKWIERPPGFNAGETSSNQNQGSFLVLE